MKKNILLTGASGYVGSRLLEKLEQQGHTVHCLARNPDNLRTTKSSTQVFQGDVLDPDSMWPAFHHVDTAYYLIHSLADRKHFMEHEIQAAMNFSGLARAAGVKRIIYLGGLGNEKDALSPHLRSRQKVGRLLRLSGVPTLELRASIILGAGSLSFEMIRSLTERLPVMVMPRWVDVKAQPIGIDDVLDYLVKSLDIELPQSRVIEIGGANQVSYRQLMAEYARQRHLTRLMLPIPVLTPRLSSHWLGLVTPLQAVVGQKLIEGVRNPTVVEDSSANTVFDILPCTASSAIARAIRQMEAEANGPPCESRVHSYRLAG